MRLTFLLLITAVNSLYSQNFKEKELKTSITDVTVFLSSAQIFESGSTVIPSGKSLLRIKNVSPFIDEKSIQVKGNGDFTILSVNHKFNYLEALKKDNVLDSLNQIIESIDSKIVLELARQEVLSEKRSVLNQNKVLGNQNSTPTIAQLKQAVDFYDTEITRIKEEEIRIAKSVSKKTEERKKIQQQLKELNEQKVLPTSEIEIRVTCDNQTNGKISITYLVSQAGWFPKYDIRVHNINKPLELIYKAEVFQHTGVDWKNVKLKFSNGNPNQSGVAPELNTWRLNYARNTVYERNPYGLPLATNIGTVRGKVLSAEGDALPGVNVVVKGTTIGTVTDVNGNYSLTLPSQSSTLVFSFVGYASQEIAATKPEMNVRLDEDVKQLSEVVVMGYGDDDGFAGRTSGVQIRGMSSRRSLKFAASVIATTVIENQTTVEFAVDMPYSIKSDGEKLGIDLKTYNIDAAYEYYAVPKLDKDAFLVARIINWDQYNLLEGEANLYFEDAYVGRSVLNAKALTDTLTISLGRDKNIVIGRTKVEQFSRKKSIGTNRIESREFKIVIRNKKSQAIKLTLFDQIPVSVLNDIVVNPVELSGGLVEEQTGKVTWEMKVEPQEQKELTLHYDVKYPKREKVILE